MSGSAPDPVPSENQVTLRDAAGGSPSAVGAGADDPTLVGAQSAEARTLHEDSRSPSGSALGAARPPSAGRHASSPSRPARTARAGGVVVGPIETTPLWQRTVAGAGERFEARSLLNVSAARTVHRAHDHDLDREVELVRIVGGEGEARLVAITRGLARLRHPSLPLCYGAGPDRHGALIAVISHPRGRPLSAWLTELSALQAGRAQRRRMLVGAVEQVARGLALAHPHTGPHGSITPEAIVIDEHGQAVLSGWGDGALPADDPYRDASDMPSPASDTRALGRVLAAVAWGHPPPRILPSRRVAGVVPEIALVIRKACDARQGAGYGDAGELAQDLARALNGESVTAGRSPWGRVVARLARRHPGRAIAVALLALAAVAGSCAPVLAWLSERSAASAHRAAIVAHVLDEMPRLRELRERIAAAALAEGAARDGWYRARAAVVNNPAEDSFGAKGVLPPALIPVEMPGSLLGDIDDQTLRGRVATSELASGARRALDSLESLPAAEAAEPRRALVELLASALLDRIETDVALARLEEWSALATATLGCVAATQPVHDRLVAQVERSPPHGLSLALTEMAERMGRARRNRVASAWREAALLLGLLGELAGRDHPFAARQAAAIRAFDAHAEIAVGEIPPGVEARLVAVTNELPCFRLGDELPLVSGQMVRWPVSEVLLVLRGEGREVRHSVLLERGERYAWRPDWPAEAPPGDFVYVPAGRVWTHSDFHYRQNRIERGVFVARCELTLGEYLPFLETLKGDPARLREFLPEHANAQVYLLRALGQRLPAEADRIEAARPGHPLTAMLIPRIAEYLTWLTDRSGGRWRYRFVNCVEWELAVRGAGGRRFPWGDGVVPALTNSSSTPRTSSFGLTEVGAFPDGRSIYGLLDGAGNTREIVSGYGGEWFRIGLCAGDPVADVTGRIPIHPVNETRGYPFDGFRLACERP